jgi:hypothetical protein
MQIIETATAEGSGFWGYESYQIELGTRFTTYTDSAGANSKTVNRYCLSFRCSLHSDIRAFTSDRDRAEFINKNFTHLKMKAIPEAEQGSTSLACPLAEVVGEYLSSVTFVMDYLQMGFSGANFNFYNWPAVALADGTLGIGESGYRGALCGLIGKTVQSIDVFLDTGLMFKFQSGETMTVSLRAPTAPRCPR